MMKAANIRKTKGASVSWLLKVLLALPFCNVSIWQFTGPAGIRFTGFCPTPVISGGSFWPVPALIRELNRLTGPSSDRVLIIDDSPYKLPRSKTVEYLGRQYDHSSGNYYLGFRLLSAGWSDDHSFVPVELELLTNAKPGKCIGPDPELDRRTHAGRRCKQACKKATEVALEMIERSQDAELPVDYVVFDCWYGHPKLIRQISLQCCLQIILVEIMMILSRVRSPHAFETACAICGVIEQFSKTIYDNSLTFKPLTSNCEKLSY